MKHSSQTPNVALLQLLARAPLAIKKDVIPSLLLPHAGPSDYYLEDGEPTTDDPTNRGGILVVPIRGVIVPCIEDAGWYECTPLDRLVDTLEAAAANPAIQGIVLDISSPGGIVWLVPEAAKKIRAIALVKPVRAVANAQAASAAYYLMTAAGKRYVTPSGEVGSVGVWCMHVDQSKMLEEIGLKVTLIFEGEHKVDGNPFEPLSKEAQADLQRSTKTTYDMFTGDVASYMGVSLKKVLADFGQGRCLQAADALTAGMVDGIATLDEVIAELAAEIAAMAEPEPAAEPREALAELETRSIEGVSVSGKRIAGTGVRWGSPSCDLGGFREIFDSAAFTDSIATDDIRVIWQHDSKFVFGRVRAGTAAITEDFDGLQYTAEPPNAQWARDAVESIRRGDVTQNSFAFMVAEPKADNQRWERRSDGVYRIITKARLVEVGPQTNPAYTDTTVAVRSMAAAIALNPALGADLPAVVPSHSVDIAARRLKLALAR